jgi:hypothetical protein
MSLGVTGQNLRATEGRGSVFDPRPDIRCPEVGKTGSRVLRLMNGKDGEDGEGRLSQWAWGCLRQRRGLTSTRQSGMVIRLRCGCQGRVIPFSFQKGTCKALAPFRQGGGVGRSPGRLPA